MSLNTPARRRRRRIQLLAVTAWRCAYCSRKISIDSMTVDHVVPRALGGAAGMANQVAACQPCNVAKGHKLLGEWKPPQPLPLVARMPRQALLAHRAAEPEAA